MALMKCPECGKENVSEFAKACPECGFRVKKYVEEVMSFKFDLPGGSMELRGKTFHMETKVSIFFRRRFGILHKRTKFSTCLPVSEALHLIEPDNNGLGAIVYLSWFTNEIDEDLDDIAFYEEDIIDDDYFDDVDEFVEGKPIKVKPIAESGSFFKENIKTIETAVKANKPILFFSERHLEEVQQFFSNIKKMEEHFAYFSL